MQSLIKSLKLIRYLIVWKANQPLVRIPRPFSTELSSVLGTIISNRLPTKEAGRWQKTLNVGSEERLGSSDLNLPKMKILPDTLWPVKSVLFPYPVKRDYGKGEPIVWELKLLGEDAHHELFLEVILPAMEEAGYTSDPRWSGINKLWGRFDIHSIYIARGAKWEPLVSEGRLDLRYRASAVQWSEGLMCEPNRERTFNGLNWLTPFSFTRIPENENVGHDPHDTEFGDQDIKVPDMRDILNALMLCLNALISKGRKAPETFWDVLSSEERSSLETVMEQVEQISLLYEDIEPVSGRSPGQWKGKLIFTPIPHDILPYLELASILHIGRQTHFGCGTFTLS